MVGAKMARLVGVEDHRFCGRMGRLWVVGTDGMNGGWYYQTEPYK